MRSVTHVAAAMEQVLTVVADRAAADVGFVRRRRVVTGALFVQALALGWLAQPEATLHQLTQALATRGAAITAQGLAKRFGPEAAALLERVLAAAIGVVITGTGVEADLLTRFGGVYLLDCTTLRLPDVLAPVWRGCGGRTPHGTASALKLQVRLDLVSGRLDGPALLAGRTHDKAGPWHAAPVPSGALLLADLGYWSLERFRALGEAGAFWLSRLDPQTHLFDPTGARLALPRWLAEQERAALAADVVLGGTARLPARLLATPVSPTVAAERRRRLRARAKRKGVQPSQATLAVADWTILVTNVPADRLSVAEAMTLGRARWQIELLFKLWKQHGRLDESRSAQPWRVLTEVSAKLTALLIQHWLLLLGGWERLDRSLVRAAQTIRAQAGGLLRTFGRPRRLREAIAALVQCLAVAGRVAKRKAKPSAFQLWRDPSLLALS